MYKCDQCGIEFDKWQQKANHVRWNHKPAKFHSAYKSNLSASHSKYIDERYGEIILFDVTCNVCGSVFDVKEREKSFPKKDKYFCSKQCANKRTQTPAMNESRRKKMKQLWEHGHYDDTTVRNHLHLRQFSSKGELEIKEYFQTNFPDDNWTSGGNIKVKDKRLSRDLYSDNLKVCIEYDGVWHFKDIHGQLKDKQYKDSLLEYWCTENDYRLVRIKEEYYHTHGINELINSVFNSKIRIIKLY